MIRMMLALIPFALVVVGCGDHGHDHDHDGDKEGAGTKEKTEEHSVHDHAAKHGGELMELGAHEGFLEAKMDHAKGEVMIWTYLGEEMKDTRLASEPVMNFMSGGKPVQLKGTPNEDGSWVFRDDVLKNEIEGARFRIVVGGKTYSPEWAHSHDHDHEHGHEEDGHDHDEDGHEHDEGGGHDHDHDGDDHDHGHDDDEKSDG